MVHGHHPLPHQEMALMVVTINMHFNIITIEVDTEVEEEEEEEDSLDSIPCLEDMGKYLYDLPVLIGYIVHCRGEKGSKLPSFAHLLQFEANYLPLKLCCHAYFIVCVHLCNLNVWSIMWACSRNVEAMLLAASVSFLGPAMLIQVEQQQEQL